TNAASWRVSRSIRLPSLESTLSMQPRGDDGVKNYLERNGPAPRWLEGPGILEWTFLLRRDLLRLRRGLGGRRVWLPCALRPPAGPDHAHQVLPLADGEPRRRDVAEDLAPFFEGHRSPRRHRPLDLAALDDHVLRAHFRDERALPAHGHDARRPHLDLRAVL